jgi:hypothetical protein
MPRTALRALVFVLIAAAARMGQAATLEERFEHTYPLPPGGVFALDNVNGDVAVAPWDRPEVRVNAVKHVKAGSEARAKELLAALEIRVTPGPAEVKVETRYPRNAGGGGFFDFLSGGGSEVSVTYRIDVPRRVRLRVATVNGSLAARGTDGAAHLRTVNGALRATDVHGPLDLASTNGAIDVAGAAGGVRASTTNGEIEVALASVGAAEATTIASTNGAITVHLPRDVRASLNARSVNGEIESPLPLTGHGRAARHLVGDLNGGGARIEISTTNGGIRIDETAR